MRVKKSVILECLILNLRYSARRQSKGAIDPKTGKPADGKEIDGKLISEYATPSTINLGDDGTEFWIPFKEFCKTFR